jgi:spoIIIJ-associated protein
MNSIESTGKNIDEAIRAGLATLSAQEGKEISLDDVDVEILSSGGFFKKAKVVLTISEDAFDEVLNKKDAPEEVKPEKKEKPAKAEKKEKPAKSEESKDAQATEQAAPEIEPKSEKSEVKERVKKEKKPFVKPVFVEEEKDYPPATDEQVATAKAYVEGLVKAMGIESDVEATSEKNIIRINILTDSAIVIGHRGETLDAIQTLAKRAAESDESHLRVIADCSGYRAKRESALTALARRNADKAARKGRKITLEPMDSASRKIIHSALSSDDRVYTKSEGHEPNRKVVIFPVRRRRYEGKNRETQSEE